MSSCDNANSGEDEEASSSSSSSSPHSVEDTTTASSPLHTLPGEFRTALEEFRNNWEREIKGYGGNAMSTLEVKANEAFAVQSSQTDAEQQTLAENLFRTAVELEQRGKVYDALPFYRKAVQIVPDIEFKFYERQNNKNTEQNTSKAYENSPNTLKNVEDEKKQRINDDVELVYDLYEKFQMDLARDHAGKLLLSNRDAAVLSTELHISDLPPEILLYILRWVVSMQLDLRSLEQCAAVCKGLYLCARDEEIWRAACVKVWGLNVGTPNQPYEDVTNELSEHITILPNTFMSWRQMFIERERVLFHGCYISKTTYLRMGENSFQDQYYRPVQLVEYFRYLRFLPDGTALMMTNADEPVIGVAKLRHMQQLRPEVLRGHYRLYGNTVSIWLRKQQQQQRFISNNISRQRRGNSSDEFNSTTYMLNLRIVNTPKRRFAQLVWLNYSIKQMRNKVETSCEFELVPSKYPPLWFSPVRSYHLDADEPLV